MSAEARKTIEMLSCETPKFIQITSAEAYYVDGEGNRHKHLTLFALDGHGRIWTRFYDGKRKMYREWFMLSNSTLSR